MSPTKRASSVAGLRRAVAVPVSEKRVSVADTSIDASATPARRPRPEKPKPIRFTLDLTRDDHQALKTYAGEIEANGAEVMRALLAELLSDPELANRVRDRVWQAH